MADKINAAGYETKPWWPYVRELMEGGGSVTVEQLNVTENGTYTAEAGKAYSPVVVNVEGGSGEATVTLNFTDETGAGIVGYGSITTFTATAMDMFQGELNYIASTNIVKCIIGGSQYVLGAVLNGHQNLETPSYESIICTGGVTFDSTTHTFNVTGDGTVTGTFRL